MTAPAPAPAPPSEAAVVVMPPPPDVTDPLPLAVKPPLPRSAARTVRMRGTIVSTTMMTSRLPRLTLQLKSPDTEITRTLMPPPLTVLRIRGEGQEGRRKVTTESERWESVCLRGGGADVCAKLLRFNLPPSLPSDAVFF